MDAVSYILSKRYTDTEVTRIVNRETDTDAMSRQAAIDANGVDKINLKTRLDDDYNRFNVIFVQGKNLYNKAVATDGELVNGTTGNYFAHATHSRSEFIPVTVGESYVFNVECNYAFYTSGQVYISGANSLIAGTPIVAPETAAFILFSVDTATAGIKDACQLEVGIAPTSYSSYGEKIDSGKIELPEDNPFSTMKWNVLGDSITAYNFYQLYVKEELRIGTVRTYGYPGSNIREGAFSFLERYPAMDDDADIITVLGGTNDWGNNVLIENEADTHDATTLKGAIRTLIEGLLTKYPGKHILWATPTHRDNGTHPTGFNANGDSMKDYWYAIKDVCAEYSIPVIDLFAESGINKFNLDLYSDDRLHPNEAGYHRIADLFVAAFRKTILQYVT